MLAVLGAFSSSEAALLLVWACAEYSFHNVSQSDLPDLTGTPWITDFRCWTGPEIAILGADQEVLTKRSAASGDENVLEGVTQGTRAHKTPENRANVTSQPSQPPPQIHPCIGVSNVIPNERGRWTRQSHYFVTLWIEKFISDKYKIFLVKI